MKKEVCGIIVCVGWSKILELTLPKNVKLLDEIYVVTKESDKDTQRVCAKYDNVHVRFYDFLISHSTWAAQHEKYMLQNASDRIKSEWREKSKDMDHFNDILRLCFNKGGAIAHVQRELYEKKPLAFHALMDSDIILPSNITNYIQGTNEQNIQVYDRETASIINGLELQSDVVYGAIHRINYLSLSDYNNSKGTRTDAGIAGHFMLVNSLNKHLMDEWTNGCGADVWYPFGLPPIRFHKHTRLPLTIHHLGNATKSTIARDFDFLFE